MADMQAGEEQVTGTYTPTSEESELIKDTVHKREQWRLDRQVHEQEWFINQAFVRGNHYVEWSDKLQRIATPKAPPHRVRLKINRLQAKVRTRLSKFLKNRPKPIVVPATGEYQDYLNAKATQKVLDYLWRKMGLEKKYKAAIQWASVAGKGFWWFHWDKTVVARVQQVDPASGKKTFVDQALGDVRIEVGSPFEVLIPDPGAETLGAQPELIRVKMRKVIDMKSRYERFKNVITASNQEESLFTYERQIAGLNPYTYTTGKRRESDDEVLVTEHFIKPNGTYPKGHYRVLVGNILVKKQDMLPYGFEDMENPYPVVEFIDLPIAGQFWAPTVCSQLVDLQREYNLMRSKLAENLRVMAHPKLLVAKQHQIPKSSWTSEAGEIIEFVAIPNIPGPQPWEPPPIASDLWRTIELLKVEFDDVSQVFPASEGKTAGATSGFQTNLLQEATDSVHAPDLRQAELSVEEAALKIRRMAKLGYTVPRLIAAVGSNMSAEVFEFVSDQIDEMADVVVEAGSALPTLKAAKQSVVMDMYKAGLLGDPADPAVRRQALSLMEMGSMEEMFDLAKTDENQAKLENRGFEQGTPVDDPHFWENHKIHYDYHTNQLKSPETKNWPGQQRLGLTRHAILHARFINPQSALQIAQEEGIQDVIPKIVAMLPPSPTGPGGPGQPGGPQGPQGGAQPPGPPPQA